MTDTLFYPEGYWSNRGIAIMRHKKTEYYVYCDIYNYKYEDGCCVFGYQLNINQKKYKIINLNWDERQGIIVKNIGRRRGFTFRDGKTLEQALEYHKGVDAII